VPNPAEESGYPTPLKDERIGLRNLSLREAFLCQEREMRTVEWDNGTVKMIDQRLLPTEYKVVTFVDVDGVATSIRDMYVRGAPAIGATAAFGMALAAQTSGATDVSSLLADLETAAALLRKTRPTAVNLFWAIDRMLRCAQNPDHGSAQAIRAALESEAQAIADQDVAINRQMGDYGQQVIQEGDNILTHCNAGALATVDYGTVLGVVRSAVEHGKKIHVWVDETRPRLQGARLTAWELMRDQIPCTLIADNAAGQLMRTGRVDVVLFGADRVAANGDVANKVGSYKLAVVARENGIPCFCVSPTSTIDMSLANGDLIPIEERNPEEVTVIRGQRIAPKGVPVANIAFDVTPRRYFTGIITERGIAYPPFDVSLPRIMRDAPA
jgi:methylthioribose-1-phosphate isomerase